MAKFVYITNGMASTLNSSFELSRRLVASGHEVIYLSHRDLAESVENQGHRFIQLNACAELLRRYQDELKSRRPLISPLNLLGLFKSGRAIRKQSIENDEIETTLKNLDPQMLIIDIEMHYAIIASSRLNIPTVLPIVWFSIFKSPGLPPMDTMLPPAETVANQARAQKEIDKAWSNLALARKLKSVWGWLSLRTIRRRVQPVSYSSNQRDDLRAIANCRGIDYDKLTDTTHWLRPHVYPRLTVLCFNAEAMEFPHQPTEKIEYVGPMVHESRKESRVDAAALVRWREFRDSRERKSQSLVYCSLGTFWSADTVFLRKVIDVFERRQDLALVIGLGGKLDDTKLGPVPENVHVMGFAPQLEILRCATAAITHGGITSINECIWFEVPMLVCSTGHVDQPGCSARIIHHKLGLSADVATSTSEEIETQLLKLINDPEIRRNVSEMKKEFDMYREQRCVEKLLESMIRS